MTKTRAYGWHPDLPDHRDFSLDLFLTAIPDHVDLRPHMPGVYDQGQLGSCTANAIAAAIEVDQKRQGLVESTPSRLMIYYLERVIEHSVQSDSGAQIRDGVKACAKTGACPESLWPYNPSRFAWKPGADAFAAAKKIIAYKRVAQSAHAIGSALAAGFGVCFGFTVYDSFESEEVAKSGIVPMPAKSESVLGGHAVLAVGYDQARKVFIVRNSWGPSWGQEGYFEMPFDYVLNPRLASDFWVIQTTQ